MVTKRIPSLSPQKREQMEALGWDAKKHHVTPEVEEMPEVKESKDESGGAVKLRLEEEDGGPNSWMTAESNTRLLNVRQ